jgi:hypothetical protein
MDLYVQLLHILVEKSTVFYRIKQNILSSNYAKSGFILSFILSHPFRVCVCVCVCECSHNITGFSSKYLCSDNVFLVKLD